MLRNTATGWGWPAKLLHWSMALLVVGQWTLGVWMVGLGDDQLVRKFQLYQLHKSLGLTLLGLALLRLLWRVSGPVPDLPSTVPAWQRSAARASHRVLYLLMLALPVTGFLMAAASPLGIPTVWFGLVRIPHPIGPDARLEEVLKLVHGTLAWVLAALVLLHVGAALKHHLLDRDEVLRRMLPGSGAR